MTLKTTFLPYKQYVGMHDTNITIISGEQGNGNFIIVQQYDDIA